MAKDRRSKDQKRKAKKAEEAKRHHTFDIEPYSGSTYRSEKWVPHVQETEIGVYESLVMTGHRLTNAQTRAAFEHLIRWLRAGKRATLTDDEMSSGLVVEVGQETELVIWTIRRHWTIFFEESGPVSSSDLIGILRTLLYSIQAHAWNTGSNKGYLHFLEGFMQRMGASVTEVPASASEGPPSQIWRRSLGE